MKKTTHSECLHPKTKAARAACRKGAQTTKIAPLTTEIQTETPTTPRIKSVLFEMTDCPRCSGTGFYGPASVKGGKCFQCAGAARVLTAKGSRARKAYQEMVNDTMGVALEDLREGDTVYATPTGYMGHNVATWATRWYRIKSIKTTANAGIGRRDDAGETVWYSSYSIEFEGCAGTVGAAQASLEGVMIPRYDSEKMQHVMTTITRKYQGATAVHAD